MAVNLAQKTISGAEVIACKPPNNSSPTPGSDPQSYVRLGRHADAVRELRTLEALSTATEIGWAVAVAARGRGLLATEERYPQDFTQAIELHGIMICTSWGEPCSASGGDCGT